MRKSLFALVAMVASSAMAQQNVDITAEQFKSGAADSQLTTLGRQAVSSGKRLVVTAPQHWHAQIASSIRAGGDAEIVLKDGFYETLLVRVEDKEAEPAIIEPKPEPKPEPVAATPKPLPTPVPVETKAEPAPAELPVPPPVQSIVDAPAPAPVSAPEPEPEPAPVVEVPTPVQQAVAEIPAAPAIEQAPDAAVAAAAGPVKSTAPNMLVAKEPGDVDPIRASMEERYNRGRRIVERVEPSQLRRSDVIHTANGAAVVVRFDGNQVLRMWLVGSINLNQTAIGNEGINKYRVLQPNLK